MEDRCVPVTVTYTWQGLFNTSWVDSRNWTNDGNIQNSYPGDQKSPVVKAVLAAQTGSFDPTTGGETIQALLANSTFSGHALSISGALKVDSAGGAGGPVSEWDAGNMTIGVGGSASFEYSNSNSGMNWLAGDINAGAAAGQFCVSAGGVDFNGSVDITDRGVNLNIGYYPNGGAASGGTLTLGTSSPAAPNLIFNTSNTTINVGTNGELDLAQEVSCTTKGQIKQATGVTGCQIVNNGVVYRNVAPSDGSLLTIGVRLLNQGGLFSIITSGSLKIDPDPWVWSLKQTSGTTTLNKRADLEATLPIKIYGGVFQTQGSSGGTTETVNADFYLYGGSLYPGENGGGSYSTLTITGNLYLYGGNVTVWVMTGAAASADKIHVTGDININNGGSGVWNNCDLGITLDGTWTVATTWNILQSDAAAIAGEFNSWSWTGFGTHTTTHGKAGASPWYYQVGTS
jgi:hypothetical protein